MAIAHVRKGDTVMVVAGKERGKRGRVLRVIPEKNRVVVERVNLIKKHQRPTQRIRQGGINTLCTGGDLAVIYVSARNPMQPSDSIHVGLPTVGATKLLPSGSTPEPPAPD